MAFHLTSQLNLAYDSVSVAFGFSSHSCTLTYAILVVFTDHEKQFVHVLNVKMQAALGEVVGNGFADTHTYN